MKCKHETPENYLVVDKNDTYKYGVGCFRVLIGGMFHPECVSEGCEFSEFIEKDDKNEN